MSLFVQLDPAIRAQAQRRLMRPMIGSVVALSVASALLTQLLDCGSTEQNAVGGLWLSVLLVVPLALVWVVISQDALKPQKRAAQAEFAAQALRCWGRIERLDPNWMADVEVFVARDVREGAPARAVGSRLNVPVTLDLGAACWWMPAQARQVGHWCAFLLHPSDPRRSYVDAVVSPRGDTMSTPEGQTLVRR